MALTKITQHVLGVDSDAISEGSTNLFHTTARARGAISVAGGYLTYSSGEVALTQSNIVGSLASQSLSPANITLSGYLRGPSSFTIDPATHGNDTGTVVIAGNLQVDGTTTTINSTTMTVDDLNMVLASGAADSAAANGAGLTIDGASATMLYTHATTSFDFNKPVNVTGAFSASGNVGIGTGSPATDLQIGDYTDNAETLTFATASDQTGRINFYNANASEGASIRVTGGGAGAKMYFANRYDSDADKVTFDLVNGKVGIGTNSPATAIHSHSASGSPELRLTTGQDSGTPTTQIGYSAGSGYFLRLADAANNEDIMLRTYGDSYFRHGPLHIGTTDSISSSSELLSVYSAGTGNTKLRNSSDSYVPLYIENASTTANTFQPFITMQSGGGNRGYVGVRYTDSVAGFSGQGGISLRTGAASLDGSTDRLVIASGGNVGIGTSDPQRLLHLQKTGGDSAILRIDTNNQSHVAGIELMSGHGNWGVYNSDTIGDALEFRDDSAGVTRMIIDSNGKVGVTAVLTVGSNAISGTTAISGELLRLDSAGDNTPLISMVQSNARLASIGAYYSNQTNSYIFLAPPEGSTDRTAEPMFYFHGQGQIKIKNTGGTIKEFLANYTGSGGNSGFVLGGVSATATNGTGNIHSLHMIQSGKITWGDWTDANALGVCEGNWNQEGTDRDYISFHHRNSMNWYGNSNGQTLSMATGGGMSIKGSLTQNQFSDMRLKKDIVPLESVLDKVNSLDVFNFNYMNPDTGEIDQERNRDTGQIGLSAQQTEELFPQVVEDRERIEGDNTVDNRNWKYLEYEKMTPILVKAVQELSAELEAAKARITTLEG